ncbi:glycosyltransferase family 4 protein [soil metagenome]
MKVVISNSRKGWGGGEAIAYMLAQGLRGRGHEVVVFCRAGSALEEHVRGELPHEPMLSGFDLNPRALWRSWRALRRHRPNVVIVNTFKDARFTGIAARATGIPVIYRQEVDQPYKNRPDYRIYFRWVPVRHVVNSEATCRTLLASVDWVEPGRVVLIPNGIDFARYSEGAEAELPLPRGALAVGFVGRMEERKGIFDVATAWESVSAEHAKAHLVVVGRGESEAAFRSHLAGAPRVHWLGFRQDVPAIIRALDVLLVPSHYEGFGLVVVEAMAAGIPVVATRTSNFPELITDGIEGRLVPPHDPPALAGAILELLRDPAQRARMGRAGRERALREFTLERMLDRHEELLAEVVAEAR